MGEPVNTNDIELEPFQQQYDSQIQASLENQVPNDQIEQDNCPKTPTSHGLSCHSDLIESCPEACMVCRRTLKVDDLKNKLKKGDHIERSMFCCLSPIKHHAIVHEVPTDEQNSFTVIGVQQKKNHSDVLNKKTRDYKINIHDEPTSKYVRIVDYKCRRHSHIETHKRAEECLKNKPTYGKYCLCIRNCEHFAVAMVSGRRDIVSKVCKVEGFKNVLQPGDHIELSNHHNAIVEKIEAEGNSKAIITTISTYTDILETNNTEERKTFVKRRSDKIDYKTINKVDYKTPKNNRTGTLESAMGYVGKESPNHYCKDFAEEMVYLGGKNTSGRKDSNEENDSSNRSNRVDNLGSNISSGSNMDARYIDNHENGEDSSIIFNSTRNEDYNSCNCIKDAMCLQSVKCFWVAFHLVLSILQCAGFILNFYLYAVYAQKDSKYDLLGNTTTNALRWCYTGCNIRGFTTICDWLFMIVMVIIYLVCYVILLRRQNKITRNICLKCKVSARLIYLTKVVLFILMELFNIFSELWIYKIVEGTHRYNVPATLAILATLSLVELIFGFFIFPALFVKCGFLRFFPKCKGCCPKRNKYCLSLCCCPWEFDKDSYKYFHLYG